MDPGDSVGDDDRGDRANRLSCLRARRFDDDVWWWPLTGHCFHDSDSVTSWLYIKDLTCLPIYQ